MKTVLITGGVRGIGKSIALAFAQKGYRVCAVYARDEASADELRALGVECYKADVSKEEDVKKLFAKVGKVMLSNWAISLGTCSRRMMAFICSTTSGLLKATSSCVSTERS